MPRFAPRLFLALAAAVSVSCEAQQPSNPTPMPSTFEYHGIIEGFYGTPWSHQDRLDILDFMGTAGLNTYFYAPKDDPFHRNRWRDPYPEDGTRRLGALAQRAETNGVTLWYALSPGLTMVYSDSSEYDRLLEKIDQVRGLGVAHFGLFLDDVVSTLTHDADRATYSSLADAHIQLSNRLQADLASRGARLAVTPTTYTDAWGDREYAATLGAGVHPDVLLLWTGSDVVSPEITATLGREWEALLSRPPLLWDNYPVNDFARWRLFLGPLTNRTADLPTSVVGLLSNPMNEAHASMIPLTTLADFVRNPQTYDPRRSLDTALDALYGPDVATALQPFIDAFGGGAYEDNVFEPLYFLPDTIDLAPITAVIARLEAALDTLGTLMTGGSQPLPPLLEDLTPFVTANRNKVAELRGDDRYGLRDGVLEYRKSLDQLRAPRMATPSVDGRLTEWDSATWTRLTGPTSGGGAPRMAAAHDGGVLYLALEVSGTAIHRKDGNGVGEGDHIALVIAHDVHATAISPEDLQILIPAPSRSGAGDATISSLRFEGFMSKYLADNRALTFNEFHLTNFGGPPGPSVRDIATGFRHAARITEAGYAVEIALPLGGRDHWKMSVTVTTTEGGKRVFSVARRNYPANPATYVDIEIVP